MSVRVKQRAMNTRNSASKDSPSSQKTYDARNGQEQNNQGSTRTIYCQCIPDIILTVWNVNGCRFIQHPHVTLHLAERHEILDEHEMHVLTYRCVRVFMLNRTPALSDSLPVPPSSSLNIPS